jgi:hypothetical protein
MRKHIARICAALAGSLALGAVPAAQAQPLPQVVERSHFGTFDGVYRSSVSSNSGDAALNLTAIRSTAAAANRAGTPVTGRLVIAGRTYDTLAGHVAPNGDLSLAGGKDLAVEVNGRIETTGPYGETPPLVRGRYSVATPRSPDAGIFALVGDLDPADPPQIGHRWEGSAKMDAGAAQSIAADLKAGSAPDTFTGNLTLGSEKFSLRGRSGGSASAPFTFVGNGAREIVAMRGRRVPSPDGTTLTALEGRLTASGGFSVPAERGATFKMNVVIPPPTIAVDTNLSPQGALEPRPDGSPRPLARLENSKNHGTDFVADELIVVTKTPLELNTFLQRWNGTILQQTTPFGGKRGTYSEVRIDTSLADPSGIVADVRALDPASREHHRVSSGQGLQLLAAAADETASGRAIGINWLGEDASHFKFQDGAATEAAGGPAGYSPNPFDWTYMRASYPGLGAAEGWKILEAAGKLGNRVDIGIVDRSFGDSGEFPSGWSIDQGGCAGGSCKAEHGTKVATVAGAIPDNSFGIAGSAGPIAGRLVMEHHSNTMFSKIDALDDAVTKYARIVNFSNSMEVDALFSASLLPFEWATEDAEESGVIVVAAAGNDGMNVDATDCIDYYFGSECWEEEWIAPCENNGVMCVGGLADGTRVRHGDSNWGKGHVDIYGPYEVFLGTDQKYTDGTKARTGNGTSYAAPYVAGVAALVWAANPSLTDNQVVGLLYKHAHSGLSPVMRVVNAVGSVKAALGEVPPFVEIDKPANGITVGYGGFNFVDFQATVADANGDCCTVQWWNSKGEHLGSGTSFKRAFPSPGAQTVTVKVADGTGKMATDDVFVNVTNALPSPVIVRPGMGWSYTTGVVYNFDGNATDPNELTIPCERLTWKSSFAGDKSFPATGCKPSVRFTQAGFRAITLTARDEYGLETSVQTWVDVVDPSPNSPPAVSIVAPAPNTYLDPWKATLLDGDVVEPDGDTISYRWIAKDWTGEEVIATTRDAWWKPSDHITPVCGPVKVTLTLEAKDKDGVGTHSTDVWVNYSVC